MDFVKMAKKLGFWTIALIMILVTTISAMALTDVCEQRGNHNYCTSWPDQAEILSLDEDLGLEIGNATITTANGNASSVSGVSLSRLIEWDNWVRFPDGITIVTGSGITAADDVDAGSGGNINLTIEATKVEIVGAITMTTGAGGSGSCSTPSCGGDDYEYCSEAGGASGFIVLDVTHDSTSPITTITSMDFNTGNAGDSSTACCASGSGGGAVDVVGPNSGAITVVMPDVTMTGGTIDMDPGNGGDADADACSGDAARCAADPGGAAGAITATFGDLILNSTDWTTKQGTPGTGNDECAGSGDRCDGARGTSGGDITTTFDDFTMISDSSLSWIGSTGANARTICTGSDEDSDYGGDASSFTVNYDNLYINDTTDIMIKTWYGGDGDDDGGGDEGAAGEQGRITHTGNYYLNNGSANYTGKQYSATRTKDGADGIYYLFTGGNFQYNDGTFSLLTQDGGNDVDGDSGGDGSTLTMTYNNITWNKNYSYRTGEGGIGGASSSSGNSGNVFFTASDSFTGATNVNISFIGEYCSDADISCSGGDVRVTLGGNITLGTDFIFEASGGSGDPGVDLGWVSYIFQNITSWDATNATIYMGAVFYPSDTGVGTRTMTWTADRNIELFGGATLINTNGTPVYNLTVSGTEAWAGFEDFNTTGTTFTVYAPNTTGASNFRSYNVSSSPITYSDATTEQTKIEFMSRLYSLTLAPTDTPLSYNFSTYNCSGDYILWNASVTFNATTTINAANATCLGNVSDGSTFSHTLTDTDIFVTPYPYNLTMKFGNYTYWGNDYDGTGNFNDSETISLEVGNINYYLQNHCSASTCLVPLTITTATAAGLNITDINISYGVADPTANEFNLSIKIYSDTEGLLNMSDPEFVYESDEQTSLRIRTYYKEPAGVKTYLDDRYITTKYSQFNLSLPSGMDYYDVYPLFTGQQGVEPWGQTKTVPVYTVTPTRNHSFIMKTRYENGTYEDCIDTYWSLDNKVDRATDLVMNETYKNIFNMTNATDQIWGFHDFDSNCSWSDLRNYFPDFEFRGVCSDCVCTYDLEEDGFCAR